jgi:hypothetical protein
LASHAVLELSAPSLQPRRDKQGAVGFPFFHVAVGQKVAVRRGASNKICGCCCKIEGEHGPIGVGRRDLGRLQFTREQAVALLLAVLGSKMLGVPELESQNDMLCR